MASLEVDRLRRGGRAREPGAEQDVAGLDHAVGRLDPQEREPPFGPARRPLDRGEELRIRRGGRVRQPGLEGGATLKGTIGQIAPQPLGFRARARLEQRVPMPPGIGRLKAHIAARQGAPLRPGTRRPPRQVGHGARPLRSSRKKPLISAKGTVSEKPMKLPSSAIPRAARMNPVHAARARLEPTLIRRTPRSARSATVSPVWADIRTLTGFGATASTTALMSFTCRGPGA